MERSTYCIFSLRHYKVGIMWNFTSLLDRQQTNNITQEFTIICIYMGK